MKKKEKKYYGKKKKFYSFFLKIFIPFIIVTSILGGIITAFLNLTFQNDISNSVRAAENTIRQTGVFIRRSLKNRKTQITSFRHHMIIILEI